MHINQGLFGSVKFISTSALSALLIGCIGSSGSSSNSGSDGNAPIPAIASNLSVQYQEDCPAPDFRIIGHDAKGALIFDDTTDENGHIDISDVPDSGFIGFARTNNMGNMTVVSAARGAVRKGDVWVFPSFAQSDAVDCPIVDDDFEDPDLTRIQINDLHEYESVRARPKDIGGDANFENQGRIDEIFSYSNFSIDTFAILGKQDGDDIFRNYSLVDVIPGADDHEPVQVSLDQTVEDILWSSPQPEIRLENAFFLKGSNSAQIDLEVKSPSANSGSLYTFQEPGRILVRSSYGIFGEEPEVNVQESFDNTSKDISIGERNPQDLSNLSKHDGEIRYEFTGKGEIETVTAFRGTINQQQEGKNLYQYLITSESNGIAVFPELPSDAQSIASNQSYDEFYLRITDYPILKDAFMLRFGWVLNDHRMSKFQDTVEWFDYDATGPGW